MAGGSLAQSGPKGLRKWTGCLQASSRRKRERRRELLFDPDQSRSPGPLSRLSCRGCSRKIGESLLGNKRFEHPMEDCEARLPERRVRQIERGPLV